MQIELVNLQKAYRIRPAGLRAVAVHVLGKLGLGSAGVTIVLVREERMRKLCRRWFPSRNTTDVLAFPLMEARVKVPGRKLLGEVVISVDNARRQAKEQGESFHSEMARLVVHGMLHLAGERDAGSRQRTKMWTLQEALVAEVLNRR